MNDVYFTKNVIDDVVYPLYNDCMFCFVLFLKILFFIINSITDEFIDLAESLRQDPKFLKSDPRKALKELFIQFVLSFITIFNNNLYRLVL